MMTTAQLAPILMLVSGLAHAIVNAVLKAGRDKMSSRALIDGFSALLVVPVALVVPFPIEALNWLIASWAVHVVYLVALIKSFENADMSTVYPIARGVAPLLAALAAVTLFGEAITALGAVGIGLISTGVAAIGARRSVSRPALGWALLTGVTIALYTVFDAQGVRAAPSALSYIVWVFLLLGGGIGVLFAFWRGGTFILAAREQWRSGLIAGALSILSYGLALLALRWGATPRLAALRETSILFGLLIAVVFLHERPGHGRLAAGAVIGLGAVILLLRG
jgi:drug/metabolite transporter (DMT)-like permease